MKSLILSFLLILSLATLNFAKPIQDIYSIKDQVYTENITVNQVTCCVYEIGLLSAPDTNAVMPADRTDIKDISVDSGVKGNNSLPHMKTKSMDVVYITDQPSDAEKLFYEKLDAKMTEQYRKQNGAANFSETPENDSYNYKMKVPRTLSALINATSED